MEFSGTVKLFGLAFFGLFLLNGCAGKNASAPKNDFPELAVADPGNESLSHSELAALKSKGEIDGDIPDHAMQDIALQYKYYLRKGRSTMCALSKRSEQYLEYARNVFRQRGMPEELANLAIVESGFRPNAVSAAGAAGAWQFMPATGLKYGLAQDAWQDERLDLFRATEAAADYLQNLYNYFGDWPTAIAAYNAGEGKMSRAKQGAGAKDFFEVKAKNEMLDEKTQLREETKQYVPRFLAITKIMRNLPQLGFEPIDPQNALPLTRLTVAPGTDLTALSRACELNWGEFTLYNQHHKRAITCTSRQTFVYVPSRSEKLAADYLASAGAGRFAGWKLAKAGKKDDSLEKISRRHNIALTLLKEANPGVGKVRPGDALLVPATASLGGKPAEQGARPAPKGGTGARHVIQPNETFYSIARKYNLDVKALMAHNGMNSPQILRPGQTLDIPGKAHPIAASSRGRIGKRPSYTVQPRDNFWSISRKFKVSVADLKRWNNMDEKALKAGTRLVVAEE